MSSGAGNSNTMLDRDGADRLAAAKLWLISDDRHLDCGNVPYLSVALFALTVVPTARVATMSSDNHWRLYLNPAWLAATDVKEVARSLAHQVWHLLADHGGRALDVGVTYSTAADWRTAADASVAEVMPWPSPDLPSTAALGLEPGRSAEENYARLSGLPTETDESPAQGSNPNTSRDASCGSGCDGIPRAYDLPPEANDFAAVDQFSADALRQRVAIDFREQLRTYGTEAGNWARWVDQILEPVVSWQQVLHAAVRRGVGWGQGHTDYTYTRISRRQAASGPVVLPALRRPVPTVAIVIDTSASVDDGLLAQALGEIDGVLATLAVSDSNVTVLAVDAEVQTVESVKSAAKLRLGGGGGTNMSLGIDAALATRPAPHVVIVLTDGFTPWPSVAAHKPIVAALIGRSSSELPDTPNWMTRVEVVPPRD